MMLHVVDVAHVCASSAVCWDADGYGMMLHVGLSTAIRFDADGDGTMLDVGHVVQVLHVVHVVHVCTSPAVCWDADGDGMMLHVAERLLAQDKAEGGQGWRRSYYMPANPDRCEA
jgi:DNA-directed RNA polymerase beta' subunit